MLQTQNSSHFVIAPEQNEHADAIELLHERAFGPGRFARTAYRLREGKAPVEGLSFVAFLNGVPVGSIRFLRVRAGASEGLLLGPLVVHPGQAGKGAGLALMQTALDAARRQGHGWVILVGDLPYYARVGFARLPFGKVTLPGPVDPDRLLVLALAPGATDRLVGPLVAV